MNVFAEAQDKYSNSKRGHEIAITDKKNAISACISEL
jgi:hypothetical protein